VELVEDGVSSGTITPRGARLILLHRVLGIRTTDIAEAEGRRPCTVRKHRQQAEAALAGLELA
jgi:DNA-directed RNA polymerase specialized sigma24 family protein